MSFICGAGLPEALIPQTIHNRHEDKLKKAKAVMLGFDRVQKTALYVSVFLENSGKHAGKRA